MYATTEKINVLFGSGIARTLRVCRRLDDGTVVTRFAGIYMRVRRFLQWYLTTEVLTGEQKQVIFGDKK
jgi:hypothetical protein